jgi:hypothetical protein
LTLPSFTGPFRLSSRPAQSNRPGNKTLPLMPWSRSCANSLPTCGSNVTTGRSRPRTGSARRRIYCRRRNRLRNKRQPRKPHPQPSLQRQATGCCGRGAGCARPGKGYHGRDRRTRMDHIHRRRFPHPLRCLLDSPCSIAHRRERGRDCLSDVSDALVRTRHRGPQTVSNRQRKSPGLRRLPAWAYRTRTGESVRELPDWICVTTSTRAGARVGGDPSRASCVIRVCSSREDFGRRLFNKKSGRHREHRVASGRVCVL